MPSAASTNTTIFICTYNPNKAQSVDLALYPLIYIGLIDSVTMSCIWNFEMMAREHWSIVLSASLACSTGYPLSLAYTPPDLHKSWQIKANLYDISPSIGGFLLHQRVLKSFHHVLSVASTHFFLCNLLYTSLLTITTDSPLLSINHNNHAAARAYGAPSQIAWSSVW